jgi:hypothetical protein
LGERAPNLSGAAVFPSRLSEPSRSTARERAIGTRLKIGINIVDERRNVGIRCEALHDRAVIAHTAKDELPERVDIG